MAVSAEMLRAGDVLLLPESDYLFGVGPVIARIKSVRGSIEYRGERWWHAAGEVANGDPSNHGGFLARELYVRQATLSRTRQVRRM